MGEIELRLATTTNAGTVELRSPDLHLVGEIDVTDVSVRPRRAGRQDGFVEVHRARGVEVRRGEIVASVQLPHVVNVGTPLRYTFPCDDVTLERAPDPPNATQSVPLKDGAQAPLRAELRGPVVAKLDVPSSPRVVAMPNALTTVDMLERRGPSVHIRIPGEDSSVVVWASASVLDMNAGIISGMGYGTGTGGFGVRCSRDVPVFVRVNGNADANIDAKTDANAHANDGDGDARVVRVGEIPAGGRVFVRGAAKNGEVAVRLGDEMVSFTPRTAGAKEARVPFVTASSIEGCPPLGSAH